MGPRTVLIAGDSWAAGEWGFENPGSYVVLHRGLEQYLRDSGYTVINKSVPGGSNRLAVELIKPTHSEISVIWFQTDPIRDLRPYKGFKSKYTTYEDILLAQKQLLLQTYSELNELDLKIICIGGCSRLDFSLIKDCSNLIPFIPSAIEFLLPQYTHPEIWFSDWYDLIDKQFDIDSVNKFLYNKQLQDGLRDQKDLFWPDGIHPNRHGHRLIFEHLMDNEDLLRQP